MAWTLGDAVGQIRQRHPAYDRERVPDRYLAAQATRIQRQLIQDAMREAPDAVSTTTSILLDLAGANQPGTVAAGSVGGLPVDGAGMLVETSAGQLLTVDLESAVELLAPFVVTAGSTASLIANALAAQTVNADIGLYIHLVDGPGSGPSAIRRVTANTATTWTLDAPLAVPPVVDATLARLILLPNATAGLGVVTALPPLEQQVGYLVRLTAAGQPYLDTTKPLIATRETGIPLPPHLLLLGGTVRRAGALGYPAGVELQLVPWTSRLRAQGWPLATVQSGTLSLLGDVSAWQSVQSIELRVVPIAPAFDLTSRTVLETPMLLPDWCQDVVIAGLAVEAARRCVVMAVPGVDLGDERQQYDQERLRFRTTLRQQYDRPTRTTTRLR